MTKGRAGNRVNVVSARELVEGRRQFDRAMGNPSIRSTASDAEEEIRILHDNVRYVRKRNSSTQFGCPQCRMRGRWVRMWTGRILRIHLEEHAIRRALGDEEEWSRTLGIATVGGEC